MAWLGVDLGTQSARALVVSPGGSVLGAGQAALLSHRSDVRHEQDPEQWWQACAQACRAATRAAAPDEVEALAVCATSGTVALVSAAGEALSPGLMYDDGRASAEAARTAAVLGVPMPSSWGLPKLLWLLANAGRTRGAVLAHQGDFVTRRLTGHDVATDWSQALKTGYDLRAERWPSSEALGALGIAANVLPEVVRPGARLGVVGEAGATATGVPLGAPVIAGMTDGCAAQLATGALEVGDWSSTLGTTLVLKGIAAEPVADPGGALYNHRSPDGRWLPGGASSTGGGALDARFPGGELAELDRRAAAYEPAGTLIYPLASEGERFPFVAPRAKRFALGEPAGAADEFAGLLQGVAYVERLCFDYLDHLGAPVYGALSLTGGATRSRYWCQLRADVLGRAVRLLECPEPAFGMAVLAAWAAGDGGRGHGLRRDFGRGLAAAAAGMVHVREVIEPRPGRAGVFREPYVRLVGELERRGWLAPDVADHARAHAG